MIIDNLNLYLFIFILFVSYLGYVMKSLTLSGALVAAIIGCLIQVGFGLNGLILLGLFFGSSSICSKFQQTRKVEFQEKVAKGEQRDYIQVLANGGIPAFISILAIIHPSIDWLFSFIVCIASANADTWASEIGSLSKQKPILITTLKKVDAGTSGAISLLGTIAAGCGALLITFVSFFLWDDLSLSILILLSLLGFLGNFIDTILGATIQVKYVCGNCSLETEKKIHCQQSTTKIKGLTLFNNDVVNFLSILIAGILAIIII